MSDITINSSENQEDNQKTTPVTGSLSEPNDSSLSLSGEIFSTWLGMRDSNPRMPGPEPGALPLGESPTHIKLYEIYSNSSSIRLQ